MQVDTQVEVEVEKYFMEPLHFHLVLLPMQLLSEVAELTLLEIKTVLV